MFLRSWCGVCVSSAAFSNMFAFLSCLIHHDRLWFRCISTIWLALVWNRTNNVLSRVQRIAPKRTIQQNSIQLIGKPRRMDKQGHTHTHSNICKCCTEETVFCKLLHAWLLWQIHLLSQINPWSDHRWRYLIRNSWVLRILMPPDLDREPGNSVMAKEDLGKIGSWNSTKKLWTCKLVAVPQACLTF